MAMTLVSTVTVGAGGASSIEFTNIPQTGKDLLVLVSGRVVQTFRNLNLTLNGSTSGYSNRYLWGNGSGAFSSNYSNISELQIPDQLTTDSQTANTFGNCAIYLSNYISSVAKSISIDSVTENNATQAFQGIFAGSWSGTSAVTTLRVFGDRNFVQHTTASLYIIS